MDENAGVHEREEERLNIRHFVILLMCVVLFFGLAQRHVEMDTSQANASVVAPMVRKDGDVRLMGNWYRNVRYGVSIEFPKGWHVRTIDDPNDSGLVEAWSDDIEMHVRLNTGVFPDITAETPDAYNLALWRVIRNIQQGIAKDSLGIFNVWVKPAGDIADLPVTSLRIDSYWPSKDGESIELWYNAYHIFGNAPVFFTLQFATMNGVATEERSQAVYKILDSVKVTSVM